MLVRRAARGRARNGLPFGNRQPRNRTMIKARLLIGAAVALFALFSYFGSSEYNPVTGKKQFISLTPRQEIALGMQAEPQMIAEYGGLYPDEAHQRALDQIGARLVQRGDAADTGWEFEFHLLDDRETINAFALPGGPVFITAALYARLETEGQVAGVIGHEIGHVVARHGAQRMAKSSLTQGLMGAVIAASGDANAGQMAAMVGQMINMQYGREDELESDELGVRLMVQAGYDPRAMIEVMKVLAESRSGEAPPEFFSTHPNPENRIAEIERAISENFPNGVPAGLTP